MSWAGLTVVMSLRLRAGSGRPEKSYQSRWRESSGIRNCKLI